MKSMVELAILVLADAGTRCRVSTVRDQKTVTDRCEQEGVSFLTITLPAFASDLERAVADGRVSSSHFPGFKRSGGLPRFLSGFLRRLFSASGTIRSDFDHGVFADLRQVLNLHRKVELPCSLAREKRAIRSFVETDASLGTPAREFRRNAQELWDGVLSKAERELFLEGVSPTHGSGASAERSDVNQRWHHPEWDTRLERVFPSWDYAISSLRQPLPHLVEPRPSRMAMVPKTLKTPRLIAVEPSYRMFMQQGLLRLIETHAERSDLWPIMGWRDQEPNRLLCRIASSGSHATLDLSEASDRVTLQHAEELFSHHKYLWDAVLATRSSEIELPDGVIHRLRKFASMGSALCFPVESMVFTTIVLGAIATARSGGIRETAHWAVSRVRIYGDDIIVPVEYAACVVAALEANGLKVNTNKSFSTGSFRESCGAEFYDGYDVTYVKARRPLPATRADTSALVSAVELRNELYRRGWLATTAYLDQHIGKIIRLHKVPVGQSCVGLWDFDQSKHRLRTNSRLQRAEVKCHIIVTTQPVSRLDGYGALSKFRWKRSSMPLSDGHLERAGRSQSLDIKTGWQALVR